MAGSPIRETCDVERLEITHNACDHTELVLRGGWRVSDGRRVASSHFDRDASPSAECEHDGGAESTQMRVNVVIAGGRVCLWCL